MVWKKAELTGRITDLLTKRRWKRVLVAYYILLVLTESTAYGNQLAELISEKTGGIYVPNPNELYPVLQALESWGSIISGTDIRNNRRKHVYYITESGIEALPVLQEALQKWYNGRVSFLEMIHDDLHRDLSELKYTDTKIPKAE